MEDKTIVNAKMMNLPILKHLDAGAIAKNAESQINKWRKGEKPVYNILRLIILGAMGYAIWVYILPPILIMVGATLGAIASALLIGGTIMALPLLFRKMKKLIRKGQERLVKSDPIGTLYELLEKAIENGREISKAKGNILSLKSEMEVGADSSEKEAKKMDSDILKLQKKVQELKSRIDNNLKEKGETYKQEDEYVDSQAELSKLLAEASRVSAQREQKKDFIVKFGSRASIMKKTAQKLTMAEAASEIKIEDFRATIEILKVDFDFSQRTKTATDKAKSALMLTNSWEYDLALDAISATIAEDIAISASNIKSIDSVTAKYGVDNDELYDNLNLLADNIKTGNDLIPVAKKYSNPEYKLTSADKIKSGGLDNIF